MFSSQTMTTPGVGRRNDARNLWGAFGDVMLILGRFSLSTPAEDGDA